MGKVIDLEERMKRPADNLITSGPWEFRKADWGSMYFIQMSKAQSRKFEMARLENGPGSPDSYLSAHFSLKGSVGYSIRAMYAHRKSREKMKEIYYLIGLIDCMINRINPILRTDLLRDMYKKICIIKERFAVNWHGHIDQVLLPIDSRYFNESEYKISLNNAGSMKELYHVIRNGTDEMFDVISNEYVFYCPDAGV